MQTRDDLKKVLGESGKVFIYGFETCNYTDFGRYLENKFKLSAYFYNDQSIGYIKNNKTKDGWTKSLKRWCKLKLANLVIENYKRKQQGLPLIPLLFVVEKEKTRLNKQTRLDVEKIASSKSDACNYTASELRRCYKLCFDLDLDPAVREIAQQTFKFVKITTLENSEYQYQTEEIDAFWKNPKWLKAWMYRTHNKNEEQSDWRQQIYDCFQKIDQDFKIEKPALQAKNEEIGVLINKLKRYCSNRQTKMQNECAMHNFFRNVIGFGAEAKLIATHRLISILLSDTKPYTLTEKDLSALTEPGSELNDIISEVDPIGILPQELQKKIIIKKECNELIGAVAKSYMMLR